jgi:hypothetical protein
VGKGILAKTLKTGVLATAVSFVFAAAAGAIEVKTLDDADAKSVTILLTGRTSPDDALRVRSFVNGIDQSKTITAQLDFSGGTISEAMAIGRFFNQAAIRTIVPSKAKCNSPCPLVLVGGRDPVTGKSSYVKYSSASLGFWGFSLNFEEKDYSATDLDSLVASTQRSILSVADYLRDVGADMNLLKYYLSTVRPNDIRYISNEQALDIGISIMSEATGQLIEPRKRR